jgi:CoA:oxalate CoA-transferase
VNSPQPGPLAGMRIIEIAHMLAGPYCGMLLADLGAEVIKIEPPSGDIARTVGAPEVDGHNTYFASLNRNKRSVVLDLASPQGQSALHALVRDAKGLITNLRPSAIKKLGLTYDRLAPSNPALACLALTGFGLSGPFADRPAYDYIIQAVTGVLTLTGDPDGPPVRAGYSMVDNSSGIMAAFALVAVIYSGRGGQVDVSLYDTLLSQLNYIASAHLNGGEEPKRYKNGAHSYFVPAQIFETKDGYLALFVTHDEFWRKMSMELGCPHWLSDPRFATTRARAENRDVVLAELETLWRTEDTAHWISRLAPLGVVIAGVETLGHALDSELTHSRQMIVQIPTVGGSLKLVASPIKIDGFQARYGLPPHLGEHTAELLQATSDRDVTK